MDDQLELHIREIILGSGHGYTVSSERADRIIKAVRDHDAPRIAELEAEVERLREIARGFVALWAVTYAANRGAPSHSHILAYHYDLLASLGARMDDFVRWEL